MEASERRETGALRAFAFVAVALAGLAIALTGISERIDNTVLDLQWSVLRKFALRKAPADIVIVGIDDQTAKSIAAPPGMWHESLGLALARIASAKPRAIGIEFPLPERSYDNVRPGLDRALLVGIAAARQNGPLVASLSIDAATRTARPKHIPVLALLGEERLGLGLLARDVDGVTRRFSLAVPTEDGAFPTLAGRICRALSRSCVDGLVNYSLGDRYAYLPLQKLLEMQDTTQLAARFHDKIVLVGEIPRYAGRIPVPVNLAAWETEAREIPAVLVHAQSLRSALQQAAPRESAKPALVILVSLAALIVLVRQPLHALVVGVLLLVALFALGSLALNGGLHVPLGGALLTVVLAWVARSAIALSRSFELRRRT